MNEHLEAAVEMLLTSTDSTDLSYVSMKMAEVASQLPTQDAIEFMDAFMSLEEIKALPEDKLYHCRRRFLTAIEHTKVVRGNEMAYFLGQYRQYGLDVELSVGPSKNNFSVTHHHDGVPYALYHNSAYVGEFDVSKVSHNMEHILPMIERHHTIIKAVYDYLRSNVEGELWVMSGGGAQLQAFFTNSTGYLGILYLDLIDDLWGTSPDYLKACGNELFTLVPNFKRNNVLFKDMAIQGVKVRKA